jgi:hypothetical protein
VKPLLEIEFDGKRRNQVRTFGRTCQSFFDCEGEPYRG